MAYGCAHSSACYIRSQCPVVHLQTRRVRKCITNSDSSHVSSSALVLQLTLRTVLSCGLNIIWMPSVMLQLPNTLRSQHVRISDLRLYLILVGRLVNMLGKYYGLGQAIALAIGLCIN